MAKCLSLTAALSFPEPALFQGGPCKKINIYLQEVFQPFGHKFQGNAREFHFVGFVSSARRSYCHPNLMHLPNTFTNHTVFNNKLLQPIQAPHGTILGQLGDNFGTALGPHVYFLVITGGAYLKWSFFFTKFPLKNSGETIDTVFLLKSTAHSSATNFKTFFRCSLVSSINRASSSLTSKPRAL